LQSCGWSRSQVIYDLRAAILLHEAHVAVIPRDEFVGQLTPENFQYCKQHLS
jgi:hypothetical protein